MQDQPDRDFVRVTLEGPGMSSVVDVDAGSAVAEGTAERSSIVDRQNESGLVSERTKSSFKRTDKKQEGKEVKNGGTYGVS